MMRAFETKHIYTKKGNLSLCATCQILFFIYLKKNAFPKAEKLKNEHGTYVWNLCSTSRQQDLGNYRIILYAFESLQRMKLCHTIVLLNTYTNITQIYTLTHVALQILCVQEETSNLTQEDKFHPSRLYSFGAFIRDGTKEFLLKSTRFFLYYHLLD